MNKKDNKNILESSKRMKQDKDILEAHISKDIMGQYVENLEDYKNLTGSEDKKNIQY